MSNGIDVASNSALLSVAEKLDTQNILLTAIAGKDNGLPIKNWGDVQTIVRMGLAPKVFAIGDQLVCNHETYGELVWDIIGFDHDTPVDKTKSHSMTIQLHSTLDDAPNDTLNFDTAEALYYAETELAAGTYNFTLLADYDEAYGGGKTYYFTLTKPVPAGGHICFSWAFNKQASEGTITTYPSQKSTEPIEKAITVTEGTEGTALENTNHTHRVRYGYNRWGHSIIRKWLNTDKLGGTWWEPSSIYDRITTTNSKKDGFLKGLDPDFIAVLGKVTKRTAINKIDGGGYEDTNELMFLISKTEAYAGKENGIDEGEPYPYYSEFTSLSSASLGADTNRIKYCGGVPKYWWSRTPDYTKGCVTRNLTIAGAFSTMNANNSTDDSFAPLCCII